MSKKKELVIKKFQFSKLNFDTKKSSNEKAFFLKLLKIFQKLQELRKHPLRMC